MDNRRPAASPTGRKVPQNNTKNKTQPKKVSGNTRANTVGRGDYVRYKGGVDRILLITVVLLICFGSVMVFSASYAYAYFETGNSYYYIQRQLLFAIIGFIAMYFAARFDYQWLKKITIPYFVVCAVLLAIVPIIGLSSGVATRWIIIAGIRFQPSELMKLGLVLFLAFYFSTFQDIILNQRNPRRAAIWEFFIPFGVVSGVCLLIALEMHFSGMIIMFLIGIIIIFVNGARKIWFILGGSIAAVFILIAISFTEYARKRIDMWLNPENYSTINETWQTTQGLYAVGSGGLLGVGLGNSQQKHLFVSEPQNDFIFAIICEELGFIGALAVIILFSIFIWRGIVIALKSPDTFSSLVVIGIIGKVALQAILNIAVVVNLIPNTGITLPFFSYGGTALMMLLGEIGLVLSISRYSYQKK